MTSLIQNTTEDYSKGTTKNHDCELSRFLSNSLLFMSSDDQEKEIELNQVLQNREKENKENEKRNKN